MSGGLPSVYHAKLPDRYQAAKQALAECDRVDECKDWADKSAAMASYAKQAKDDKLQSLAMRIKARAISRAGELLREIEPMSPQESGKLQGRGGGPPTSRKAVAAAAGFSPDQAKTAIRVANVPRETFEELVEAEKPATVTQLAELGKRTGRTTKQVETHYKIARETMRPGFSAALYMAGDIEDLARRCRVNDPTSIANGLSPGRTKDLRASIADIIVWLNDFDNHLQGKDGTS